MHLSARRIMEFGYAILNNIHFDVASDTMPPRPPNSSFIVVECQTAPNNSNKRVCVPKSWVQCEMTEKKVAIAYPAEDETSIAKRIKNNEPADGSWLHYIGEIKYEAESYQDAIIGFLTNGENVKQTEEKNCKNDAAAIPKDSLKLRIVVPKLKLKSEKEKKDSLKKHMKKHQKNKIHKSKHKNVEKQLLKENKPDLKIVNRKKTSSNAVQSKKTKEFSPCDPIPNCKNNVNGSQKSLESKIEDVILSSLQESLKHLNNNNQNTDRSKNSLSGGLDIEPEEEIDFSNLNLSPEDKRKLQTLDIDQRHTLGYIKAVLINIKTLYLKVIENKKTLNSIVSKYKKQQPSATSPIETNLQNGHTLEEETTQSDDMDTLRFDEMDSDDDFENKNDTTPLKIKQENLLEEMHTSMQNDSDFETFIDDEVSSLDSLPSSPKVVTPKKNNYNRKNGRWTLKHQHPGKGLVPLGGRDSRVYISAKALEEIKRTSDSVQMFARLLCKAVFTPEALKTCSMTGKKATGNGRHTKIRPALHSHARTVIVNYSMSYGKQAGWREIQLSSLVQSLRCLLQRCRGDRIRKRSAKKIRSHDS
ncbi:hypothetical protein PYW07_011611 [Mythimna separata]|uniref:BEN domain-containing protein n=1 Tax=Mythimna separata TaxID=271217 RepID=A0AAD8DK26_MYTSE|nr:hypothetical protein PYW07_011611 [Mythimna separata]